MRILKLHVSTSGRYTDPSPPLHCACERALVVLSQRMREPAHARTCFAASARMRRHAKSLTQRRAQLARLVRARSGVPGVHDFASARSRGFEKSSTECAIAGRITLPRLGDSC